MWDFRTLLRETKTHFPSITKSFNVSRGELVNPKSALPHQSTSTIPEKPEEMSIQPIQEHNIHTVAGENTQLLGDDEGMEGEGTETLDPRLLHWVLMMWYWIWI
jgi:hypothetical protein